MQSDLAWRRSDGDDRNPIVTVEHNEYCGGCQKHLTFRLGSEVVVIRTDDNGLKAISDAIAKHPQVMLQKVQAEFEAVKKKLESFGPLPDPNN